MKIGYLGPKNSFTFQAANEIGEEEELMAYPSIPLCIQALEQKDISFAVVPIENSLEGSVHASVDRLFQQKDIFVVGEIVLPIRQQLLGIPGKKIRKILSHPQALAQSQIFLDSTYPNVPLEAVASTTFAAEFVRNHPEQECAAIASEKAASQYNLDILAADIQDNAFNQTRFWVLTTMKQEISFPSLGKPARNTLFITLPANTPGALHKVLSCFAWRGIDLSKIESRPLKTNLGEYFFIVDLNLDDNQQLICNAIEEIRLLKGEVREIGSYPVKIFQ